MKIEAWMKRPAISVRPRDSLLAARQLLEERRINQLLVVMEGRLVGIVTDRDLRDAFPSILEVLKHRRVRATSTDPGAVPVEDVMTRNVVTLPPDATVVDAARIMRRERIGAIPIVDHGKPVGIITRSDVLDCFTELAGDTDPIG